MSLLKLFLQGVSSGGTTGGGGDPGGGGGLPANVLTINGQAVTLNSVYVTLTQ